MYVSIKSITGAMYNGLVHNIQVDTDESYCANMIAVHNCTNKKLGWKEFHHPIMVHPEWNNEMEAELRQIFTNEAAWEHEELAEFGTEVTGVFNKAHIDRARKDYEYTEFPFYPALRTIGVDWDKYGAETQILVLEYKIDPLTGEGKFMVLNRRAVPKGEFTLDNGVEIIKDYNARYNPQFIYVDRGFGEHQIETLHKYGLDHPETELARKVKGIAFGSSIEVRDPFTKELIKKPIKPFMVDQFSIQLERDRVILNDNDVDLWRDLENYNIVRWTDQGRPIFTSQNEHTIDALMLATAAFIIEMPDLSGTIAPPNLAKHMAKARVNQPDPLKNLYQKDIKETNDPFPEEAGRLRKVNTGTKPQHNNRTARWGRGSDSDRKIKRKTW
jgi:replicative DNA helicase